MAKSNREIPHYYLQTLINMGAALAWLEQENLKRSIKDRVLPAVLLIKATALGLAGYPKMAGAAASLMGFVQMGLGAGAGMIVGHGVQASATPLALTVAGGMLFSLATWALLLRR